MKSGRSAGHLSMRAVKTSRATQVGIIFALAIRGAYTAGCGTVPKRNPLPLELSESAVIPGIPNAGLWRDESLPTVSEIHSLSQEQLQARYSAIYGKEHSFLTFSGGGANGAFGAEHMGKLFDLAYILAKEGFPWLTYPPGAEVQ